MRMPSVLLLLLLLSFIPLGTNAQYNAPQNKVWIFGSHARVDFNSGVPVAGGVSPATVLEGGACVSGSAGNLLFYTDGDTVFNRLGSVMPSGGNITPYYTWSTTQSSLIVPFIGDTNKYYIFSMEQQALGSYLHCHLTYSVVDMTLDGGLGNLVTAGIPLGDEMSEKLIAIPGEDCNMWIITHKKDTTQFYVYEVTASGIGVPTVYNEGTFMGVPGSSAHPGFGGYAYGAMKASHDRHTIFTACWTGAASFRGGELYDFDPATGVISNCRVLSIMEGFYGAEFSPDNTKLYACSADSSSVVQFDISLPSIAAVRASRMKVSTGTIFSDVKLAPDGKIYVGNGNYLDCISAPNNAGLASGYVVHAVNLSPAGCMVGLPNLVWNASNMPVITGPVTICKGNAATYGATISGGAWSSSNTSVLTIDPVTGVAATVASGADTISYSVPGTCTVTFIVTVNPSPALLGDVASVCVGGTLALTNAVGGGTWSSSATAIGTIDLSSGLAGGISVGTTLITYAIGACYVTTAISVVNCPSGIGHVAFGDGITMYPVPATENIYIRSTSLFAPGMNAVICDMSGRKLAIVSLSGRDVSISLKDMAPGTYQCIISDGNSVLTRRLVVKG